MFGKKKTTPEEYRREIACAIDKRHITNISRNNPEKDLGEITKDKGHDETLLALSGLELVGVLTPSKVLNTNEYRVVAEGNAVEVYDSYLKEEKEE